MKTTILSTITLIAFTFTSLNTSFGEYIITLDDAKLIEKDRTNKTTDFKEKLCYYVNQRSPWDLELIKKTFLAQSNYFLWKLENNNKEILKSRALTEKEISDYNEIKKIFDLEKKDPKVTSFKICDKFMEKFKDNLYDEVELFKNNKKELGEEYKNAIFTKKHDKLNYYTSKILDTDVAVVRSNNLAKTIKEVLTYKAFIIEKADSKWNVVWFYLFVKNTTISDKTTKLNEFDNEVLTSDFLAKIYKKIDAEMWKDSWGKAAPITKVIKWYYFYNFYKN